MGSGKVFICSSCGERFSAMTGIGRLFPKIYEETVKKMRSGKYGDECKKFFKEHPDGAVNCEKELLICEECGVPKTEMNLSLYLPKKGAKNIPEMPFGNDFRKFTLYAEYPHKCDQCGGICNVVKSSKIKRMTCPVCKGVMQEDPAGLILWD